MKRTLAAFLVILLLTIGLLPGGASAFTDRWGFLNPVADDSAILDIAYGNGTWVAVGKLGAVVTSKDGTAWAPQNSPTAADLLSVAFGNGKFVAVGKEPLLSTDGKSWQKVTITAKGIATSVIFAAGKFTAATDAGETYDSADGASWKLAKSFGSPFRSAPQFQTLAYGNGLYLLWAGGHNYSYGTITSTESPVSWGTCSRTLYLGGKFLTLCQEFVVTTSGNRSERQEVPTWILLRDAVHDGRRYVAVGDSGTIVTSPDGRTWTVQDKPRQAPDYYALEYANGLYVLAGDDGRIWTSQDAAAWTLRYGGYKVDLAGIAGAEGRWVAVGAEGAILSSPNPWPWQWTRRSSGTQQPLAAVTAGLDRFVAVGARGAIVTSDDGLTWTPQTSGTDADLQGVTFANGRFVAAGKNAAGKAVVLSSENGQAWKAQALDLPGFVGLAYGQGRFVAVGSGGLVATSADGTAWTKAATPAQGDLYGVAFGAGRFLAVGAAGLVLTSPDGAVWTKVAGTGAQPLYAVTFAAGRFFVAGDKGMVGYSADGLALQMTPDSIGADMRALAVQGDRLLAVGLGGAIRSWAMPNTAKSTAAASAQEVKVGDEFTLKVTVLDEYGMGQGDRVVTMTQTPALVEVVQAKATTYYTGEASFKVRALKGGTVRFTFTADDGTPLGWPVMVSIEDPAAKPAPPAEPTDEKPVTPPPPVSDCGKRFADVPGTHPNCAAIEKLALLEVIKGYADGFHPDQGLTRAELATMLTRALKLPPAPADKLPFSDTDGHWAAAAGYLQAAVKAGAFGGNPDGTFRPDDPVTRAQLVKVVAAAAQLKASGLPTYSDVAEQDWYAGWVNAALQARLIGAQAAYPVYAEPAFQGDKPANRAEASAILANLLAR